MGRILRAASLLLLPVAAWAAQVQPEFGLDTAKIEALTGLKGTAFGEERVFKVSAPRSDIAVTVDGLKMKPPMGLTSWAAFKKGPGGAIVMGDLTMLEDEVNPVMSACLDGGLEVTALHNHFFYDAPKVMFMHIGGHGSVEHLAGAVRKALDKIKEVRAAAPSGPLRAAAFAPSGKLDAAAIEAIVGHKGQSAGDVFKITVGRKASHHGVEVTNNLGMNTWMAFAGSDADARVDGDFAMREGELQGVLKALRSSGIEVVAIHNHMTGEEPRTVFLHFWGRGATRQLAEGLKKALALTKD